MSQHVLTETGSMLPIQTLRNLTSAEIDDPCETRWRSQFDNKTEAFYVKNFSPTPKWTNRRQDPGDDKLETYPMCNNYNVYEDLV